MRWKSAVALFAAIALADAALAQGPPLPISATSGSATPALLPPIVPPGRPAIGIALEGGGALGLAHFGVLQWFEVHHIPIDRISGTSMGSLVGALYASGASPAQMQELAVSDAFTRVFSLQTPYADASYRRRQDRHEMPQAITVHAPIKSSTTTAQRRAPGVRSTSCTPSSSGGTQGGIEASMRSRGTPGSVMRRPPGARRRRSPRPARWRAAGLVAPA